MVKKREKSTKKFRYIFFQKYYIHFTFSCCTPVARWMSVSVSATRNTGRDAAQYLRRIFQELICEFNICALNPRRVSPRQKQVSNKGNFLMICLQTTKKQIKTIQYNKNPTTTRHSDRWMCSWWETVLRIRCDLCSACDVAVFWHRLGSVLHIFLPFQKDKNKMKTLRYAD